MKQIIDFILQFAILLSTPLVFMYFFHLLAGHNADMCGTIVSTIWLSAVVGAILNWRNE